MAKNTLLTHKQHIQWLQDIELWRREHDEALGELKRLLTQQARLFDDHIIAIDEHRTALESDSVHHSEHLNEHVRHKRLERRHRKLMTVLRDARSLVDAEEQCA